MRPVDPGSHPGDHSDHGVLRARVVTVSDQVAAGLDADRAGPLAVELLARAGVSADLVVVPDDPRQLRDAVGAAIAAGCRIVVTCGGTGIGPDDHTTAVVRELLSFEIPGIAEEIRRRGIGHTPQALLSREIAGAVVGDGHAPVFLLAAPGSRGGVRDALGVVGDLLAYLIGQLDGAGHM